MLARFRQLARQYVEMQEFNTALYWAELAVSLSKDDIEDVYLAAKCMFSIRQFVRGAHLIMDRGLDKKSLWCKLLAGRCLHEAKLYSETIALVEKLEEPATGNKDELNISGNALSFLYLLRGKAYEASDNRILAIENYRTALKHDVYCYEALQLLSRHHMLTHDEEEDLLDNLAFSEQCAGYPGEAAIVHSLFKDNLRKYSKPHEIPTDNTLEPLKDNLNLKANFADRFIHNARFDDAYRLTNSILKVDPYHPAAVLLHVTTLVELRNSCELFSLAHRLVEIDAEDPVAWFCVACYYFTIGSNEISRKYLDKVNSLDRDFGPAHLLRGHAFAADSERDQAMACYFKVSQIMKGYHLPLLYLGMEHAMTNSLKLAEGFFVKAADIMPNDPMVWHELGMVSFRNKDYRQAEKHFLQAYELVKDLPFRMDVTWEPLLNNLGHVSRKLKKYTKALEYHQQALMLRPDHAATYSAMGFVHAFLGQYSDALEYFHKALGCKPDDAFSTTMLNKVLELYVKETAPFDGADDDSFQPLAAAATTNAATATAATPNVSGVSRLTSSAMEISSSFADATDFL